MLHLIKMWLTAPVEEDDGQGSKKRTTLNRDEKRGTPQGSPISPLLSNLYMRRFILGWQKLGYTDRFQAEIVNYADDLVICCRRNADEAMVAMRQLMERLKLTVNEEKTRACRVPHDSFDFLGYTFGRLYSPRTGRPYIGARPSKKSIERVIDKISAETDRKTTFRSEGEVIHKLNDILRGWANYFRFGTFGKVYGAVDAHARQRLRRWLCGKYQVRGPSRPHYPDQHLHERTGLIDLPKLARSDSWAMV
jgi:hypothetical protein